MNPDSHIQTKSVLLNKEVHQAGHVIPRSQWIQSHNPRVLVEEKLDELVLRVEAEVLAADPEYISWQVMYPMTWWDHFKKDVMIPLTRNPSTRLGKRLYRWATRWHSEVKTYRRKINRRVCPHLDVPPYPGEYRSAHVEWLTFDQSEVT